MDMVITSAFLRKLYLSSNYLSLWKDSQELIHYTGREVADIAYPKANPLSYDVF